MEVLRRMFDPDYHPWAKMLGSWLGLVITGITLSKLVALATLALTVTQLFFVWRDKWWRDPKRQNGRALHRLRRRK